MWRVGNELNPWPGPSALVRLAVVPLVLAALLFIPAGHLAWTGGWLFLLVAVGALAAAAFHLWRVNPEIFVARSRIQKGTKGWDRFLLAFLLPAFLAILPVASIDAGRSQWPQVSWWVVSLGYVLLLAGIAITVRAQAVNRFFEPGVRIQTERGHRVVDTGPYAIVRHPGYFAACLLFAGIALSLGSFWALIPAGLATLLLVLRTVWEDRTLRRELPGYSDYAQRVRFRLIPGVW
jgi:protein-S-isoprenylcysteine O-methyltransferase Ste14